MPKSISSKFMLMNPKSEAFKAIKRTWRSLNSINCRACFKMISLFWSELSGRVFHSLKVT